MAYAGYAHLDATTGKVVASEVSSVSSGSTVMTVGFDGSTSGSLYGAAFNSSFTRLCRAGKILLNRSGTSSGSFLMTTGSITTDYICFDPGTSKFYGSSAGTTVTRYDDDDTLSNSAAMSFSGTAPTSILGIDSDGTNIWILDNVTGTKSLKKYSVSGTTLTYVSTATLDTNNPDYCLVIIGSNFYTYYSTSKILYRFNSSGVTQSSLTMSVSSSITILGLANDRQGNMRIGQLSPNGTSGVSHTWSVTSV